MLEQLKKGNFAFHFMTKGRIHIAAGVSTLLILVAVVSFFARGLNFGIDFTGGTLVEAGYEEPVEVSEIRTLLQKGEYADATVQHFGTTREVMIRLGASEGKSNEAISTDILALLKSGGRELEMRRVEFVGPQVGDELIEQGGLAMLYTLIGILIYVGLRFEYRFAMGAVLALAHDTVITIGVFSVLGLEFDLTVLAAVLAIIGYSLNDTIVVFDRIRDNFLKMRKRPSEEIMNASINQTLIRTIMTSITTLLVVLALFFLGGKLIHGFASALIVGIVVGTYSSIYVASSLTLALGVSKADLMPVQKEGEKTNELS